MGPASTKLQVQKTLVYNKATQDSRVGIVGDAVFTARVESK